MPIFAFKLALFLNFWFQILGPGLEQESHFSAHTEVGYDKDGEFTKERVSAELSLVIDLVEELLHRYRLDLHNVANIQIVNPLVLIEET